MPCRASRRRPSRREGAVAPGGAGHGCGHNLLGVAALGAAVAVKEQIAAGRLKGTVRFYGCPAEETLVGKLYMARAGLFDDLDVALAWHPGDRTAADTEGTRAQVDFRVEFRGRAAHAASNPWAGRSALDALELFTHGLNLMREHVKPSVRMHYVITNGGKVPNIVPDYARALVLGPRLAAGRGRGGPGPAAQGCRGGGPDGRGRGQADGAKRRARDARQRGGREARAGEPGAARAGRIHGRGAAVRPRGAAGVRRGAQGPGRLGPAAPPAAARPDPRLDRRGRRELAGADAEPAGHDGTGRRARPRLAGRGLQPGLRWATAG